MVEAPVWESGERLRLGFSYEFPVSWYETDVARGNAHVERRGPFLLVFCTLVPDDEVRAMEPYFARIRNSIAVHRAALWQEGR